MKPFYDDIKAYIDGELSPAERLAFEAALEQDSELRDEVNFMKQLTGSVQDLQADEIRVPGDPAAVMNQIRGTRRLARWPIALGLAGTFLVMVVGLVSFAGQGSGESSPTAGVAMTKGAEGGEVAEGSSAPVVRNRVKFEESESQPASKSDVPMPSRSFTLKEQSAAPPAGISAQLIRTASVELVVPSVAETLKRASQIAEGLGGFVTDSSASDAQNVLATGSATLRVPVKQFSTALARLKELGEVQAESSNSEDVTTQVADVNARLKVLRAEEESYVTMLRAARRVGELLEIRERLSTVRQEIESLDAQRRALADQTSFSTISLSLSQRVKVGEPKSSPSWSDDAWSRAVNGLQSAGRWLGQAAIYAFVYSPFWVPIIVIPVWLARRKR